MPREHDCEVVMGLETDPSDAQKGLQELENSAEDAAHKTAKAAAEAASTTTDAVRQACETVQKQSKQTTDQLGEDADKAGKNTRRSAQETKDEVVATFQAGQIAIGNLISACVQKVTSAMADAGKQLISTGVAYNAQIETYRTGLTNMLGDAEKANKALAAMQADAARTPFDTATLVKSNQYLISAGENAEYSRKTILALGDAVSATGGGSAELERMAQNLQQVANAGKASSVDVKQFAMAGINIYQVLADYTGKSVQDVQGMTITYDVLTQALQAAAEEGGRYYNSMSTQSETLTGRLSTLKDNATQLAGTMTEELASAMGTVVEKANDVVIAMKDGWDTGGLDGLLQAVRETAPELSGLADIIQFCSDHSQTLITLLGMAAGAMLTYSTAATTAKIAQAALNLVMTANPIGIVITLLGALAGAFATAYASSETFRTKVNDAFQSVASNAKSAISTTISWLDQLSYKLNRALGKNGYTGYSSYEDWKADQSQNTGTGGSKNTVTDADRQRRLEKHLQRIQQAQNEKAQDDISSSIPSGTSDANKSKKGSTAKKTVTERTDWSQQDAATSYSQNDYGQVTTATTELTEHILQSDGNEYTKFTKTVTESGKEMVNGVIKDYKTVTTYVDKFDKDGKKIGDTVAQTQKVYEDAANTISSTSKKTSSTIENGITKTTETTKKKMADGKEHTVEVVTETGERIVEGVAETYTKATTYVDGFKQDVQESAEVIEQTVKATQKRIEQNTSEINSQLSKGIFGITKNIVSGLKDQNWGEVGQQIINLIWGEVDQKQRDAITDWAAKALDAVNEAYNGGGVQGAVDAVKALFADGFKNGSGEQIDSIAKIIENLTASGGMGEKLGKLATQVGEAGTKIIGVLGTVGTSIGTFVSNAGAGIASLASSFGSLGGAVGSVGSAISSLGGLILANPEIAAVLAAVAIVAGVIGLGVWLWKKYGQSSATGSADSTVTAPDLAPAGSYTPSDTITAAELTRRTQAAAAANQGRLSGLQSSTGTVASQQLNATLHGSLTATFNVDGREMAQATVPYMDEELGFRQ